MRHLPLLRSECRDGPRPCPYVSCRHHLYLDVSRNGNLILNFPGLEPDELEHSCSLDIAEAGARRLEDVGTVLNLVRDRIRQIEVRVLAKLEISLRAAGVGLDDLSPVELPD